MTIEEALSKIHALDWDNKRAREISKEIMCHSRMDKSCCHVLLKQHPSEDPAIFKWRKDNFTHITNPLFQKAVNSLYRIFQTTDHSYTVSQDTLDYLKKARFAKGLSFDTFMQQYCLRAMIEDPNGWLVVLPKFPVPASSNQSVEIDLRIIWSTHQIYQDDDLIIFSDQCINGAFATVKSGFAVDRERVVKFQRNGTSYTITDIYFHELGEIPYTVLGGTVTTDDVYVSFFQPFVEFGNQALCFYSEWQVTKGSCTFPIKEMDGIECKTCNGRGYDNENKPCGTCHGSKYENLSFSPGTVLIRPALRPGEPERTRPLLDYISPPVDIIQEQKADWQLMLDKALESLNLHFVLEQQSGIAKDIDRAEFYSFLGQIAEVLFGNNEWRTLDFIERMRRFQTAEPVIVNIPTTYTVETKSDLLDDMAKALATPFTPTRADAIRRLNKYTNANNPTEIKIVEFMLMYNPLFCKSEAEASIAVDLGGITQDEYSECLYMYPQLLLLINDMQTGENGNPKWFLETDYATIYEALDERISAKLASEESEGTDLQTDQQPEAMGVLS